ncbi:MAG: Hsp33 family molecular chaperone HslO [Eubacteriales bacterium]|nr:Hsp33 family molecular chaperone HslO [Eubacteriales bacterium]
MQDRLIRAICKDAAVKCTAVSTTQLVERARNIHKTLPLATAALGRALSGASMMGRELKDQDGSVTLQFKGDGPLGTITAVADCEGNVRGYLQNPAAELPLKPDGHLDVGSGVGRGYLMVIKDIGVGEPFTGTTVLHNGEIAEDLTKYFAESEQIPSAAALGVLVDTNQSVKQAGGYLVQLLPGATDEEITRLENNIAAAGGMTTMMERGLSLEEIVRTVLDGFSVEFLEEVPIEYRCGCSHSKVTRALISLGKDELTRLRDEEDGIEVTCQFCDKVYNLSHEDIDVLLTAATAREIE